MRLSNAFRPQRMWFFSVEWRTRERPCRIISTSDDEDDCCVQATMLNNNSSCTTQHFSTDGIRFGATDFMMTKCCVLCFCVGYIITASRKLLTLIECLFNKLFLFFFSFLFLFFTLSLSILWTHDTFCLSFAPFNYIDSTANTHVECRARTATSTDR